MASIESTTEFVRGGGNTAAYKQWLAITNADEAVAIVASEQSPIAGSVQVGGTLGGATVTLQGSNNGTTYFTLRDVYGSPLSFTAAALAEFSTTAIYIKPVITGGSGSSVNVFMALRG